ncbi:MAG: 50S ribosomal protein L10 [Bacteroidia bacterium]|nr:50S ribosomal protein L10 [Bacteroidia bacterium]MCC7533110.1 50S ribosomal protein L10 [Bacteroidia bacterium]MCZ2141743.1 50S ribosomal protein L10 [Bacteroidia bacterium]
MNREQKAEIIDSLAKKIADFNFIYITDVSTLDSQKTSDLRRSFFNNGVEMIVAKNTLVEKAIEKSEKQFGGLVDTLKGNTALLFSTDSKSPAKIIKEFRKDKTKPYLKGAYIDSDIFIGDDQLDALIKLKSRNELIGEVIGLLQSPAKNVVSALQSSGGKLAGIIKTLSEKPE